MVCWVAERLFWPFVNKGDHLDPKAENLNSSVTEKVGLLNSSVLPLKTP